MGRASPVRVKWQRVRALRPDERPGIALADQSGDRDITRDARERDTPVACARGGGGRTVRLGARARVPRCVLRMRRLRRVHCARR